MSYSVTKTATQTFTETHARHLASKVRTNLMRMHHLYNGVPTKEKIDDYHIEITEMLRGKYLSTVQYGFSRDGVFIRPMLMYEMEELTGSSAVDDDPGQVRPGYDVHDAVFGSFITYNSAWFALSEQERAEIRSRIPIMRSPGAEPGMDGYLARDHTYSAGGAALNRYSLR